MVRLGVVPRNPDVFVHVEGDDILCVQLILTGPLTPWLWGTVTREDDMDVTYLEADTAVVEDLHDPLVHRQRARARREAQHKERPVGRRGEVVDAANDVVGNLSGQRSVSACP